MYTRPAMPQLIESILGQVDLRTVLDIGITALLIYWLFSLIRGTSAVRLVIGVTVLFAVYFTARTLQLKLLQQILETGAVVGLLALVVVFQPELRRALDRIGRELAAAGDGTPRVDWRALPTTLEALFQDIYNEPPQWYAGGRHDGFSIYALNSSLHRMTAATGAAMTAAPRSSSSSSGFSGGSSGGGFGGGGGGGF